MGTPHEPGSGFRGIPAIHRLVDRVLETEGADGIPRGLVVDAARAVIDDVRFLVARGADAVADSLDSLAVRVVKRLEQERSPVLAPMINATGVIIHTGLGRAPLAEAAVAAAAEAAGRYVPVELDVERGERGRRTELVRDLLCRLTGAESASVVNNNAAAMLLVLSTLARDREVIVSRGELVEIGGSFRLPEVMAAGGAVLREVGTTNRTRLADYEHAIGESTAALLKVHPANYRIEGFTESVSIQALADLGRRHRVPVVHDIGSGLLRPSDRVAALAEEPDAATSVAAGADLILFSGDKLLGGPQSGIIVGRREHVTALERNPMMRAIRVDKITLAALGATLQLHRDPDLAAAQVPVWRMLTADTDRLQQRARALEQGLRDAPGLAALEVRPSQAFVGGGSLPTHAIPSVALVIRAESLSEDELARRLRTGTPAVLPRVSDGAVWLDLRTVFPDEEEGLAAAVRAGVTP